MPHGIAFALTFLLCKDQAMSAVVPALSLLNSFPCVIRRIAFDENDLILWTHHWTTNKNIVDISRFIACRHNNRNRRMSPGLGFEGAGDHDVEDGERPEKRQRGEITI